MNRLALITLAVLTILCAGCGTANLIHRQIGAVIGPQLTADLERERQIAAEYNDELLLQCADWKLANLPKAQKLLEEPTVGPHSEAAKIRETERMFAAGSPWMTGLAKACGPVGSEILAQFGIHR